MNYLISANWKMNGDKAFVKSYLSSVNIEEDPEVQMLICPPDCYLQEMDTNASQIVSRGAQNLSFNSNGAYTGEVSVEMLHDHNVQYVIVGHSERRQFHSETNEIVAKKFKTAIDNDIIPILCVGETIIHSDKQFVVAYEPIWAIGTGETATPELANESHIFIKDTINEICPSNEHNVVIIYGGSVNSSNATDLFKMSHINGALIGGASLDVNEFIKIFNIAKEINHE